MRNRFCHRTTDFSDNIPSRLLQLTKRPLTLACTPACSGEHRGGRPVLQAARCSYRARAGRRSRGRRVDVCVPWTARAAEPL
eukprot:108347-Chlamydomonas_euryale.AAC.11